MSFGSFVLISFAFLFIAFIWAMNGSARRAGEDRIKAEQGKAAGRARRDAQEAERRVDGMSDDDASTRLRDDWSRD